jgi:hypothetical protein
VIKAVYRQGKIHLIDAVPADWPDGLELEIEPAEIDPTPDELDAWMADVKAATANITDEDHDKFMAALAEVEAESKILGRRELERSP